MYNDTMTVANKIITYNDLTEIFEKMYEDLEKYTKMFKYEESKNQMLDYSYQDWTLKGFSGTLKFYVNFYDDTRIEFDNYNNFLTIFNNRLDEIKHIYVTYGLSYAVSHPGMQKEYYNQSIRMEIYETKAHIIVSLCSTDNKMEDVYNLIKNKILDAPIKYDRIIKKKNSIINKVGFAIGLIPAIIIATLLIFVPTIKEIYSTGYIVYPIICILLGFVIGVSLFTGKLNSLYSTIKPEQKYAGYDKNKHKNVYEDDVSKYVNTSEILIGKNVDNLKKRKEIEEIENRYSGFIPIELVIILVISIIVIFI